MRIDRGLDMGLLGRARTWEAAARAAASRLGVVWASKDALARYLLGVLRAIPAPARSLVEDDDDGERWVRECHGRGRAVGGGVSWQRESGG